MTGSDMLRRAVLEHGRVEGDILRVDTFLNHRVEPVLIEAIGADLAKSLGTIDLVLTAEASGIPPALAVAALTGVPCVYAKKYPRGRERLGFFRDVVSATKGVEYRVEVGRHVLPRGAAVGIVDDFLAGGRTAEALAEITEEAGSRVAGLAFVIEKVFAGGRQRLEDRGWKVEALVRIESLADGVIRLAGGP